jgi:hypothetical protein
VPVEHPIQNLDTVDIVGRRQDGGVDLFIVVNAPLTGSGEHQALLLDKIDSYLRQIESAAFRAEMGEPTPDRVRIVVQCAHPPHAAIRELLQRAMLWVDEHHASLVLRVDGEG